MRTLARAGLVVAVMLAAGGLETRAAIFTVTTTNDAGAGSFRQALLSANATPGANSIRFDLPGTGVHTLAPFTTLPDITNRVTIEGFSQPGSSPNSLTNGNNAVLRVRLDGLGVTNNAFAIGLRFNGVNGCTVRGLVIVRFYTGIQLNASSGNTIAGNWIGVDVDGISRGGTGTGVDVTCAAFNRSTGNLIGGTTPADRNVIGGYYTGVSFFPGPADHNSVLGNFIGTDPTGALPRGNFNYGVYSQGAGTNLMGGASPGAGNVIAANGTGIFLLGSSGNVIQGNYIGTDVGGRYALGNTGDGIGVQGGALTTIGGSGAGNLIANNGGNGIMLLGATNSVIQGNWIGTDAGRVWPMGNNKEGVLLFGGGAALIGGTAPGQGNVIQFNKNAGVQVYSGDRNTISANTIFDNGGLGIDLAPVGVATNDVADPDSGPNQLQNYPVLSKAATSFGTTQVEGALNSTPSTTFQLEFFAAPAWDATGNPEGSLFLGATNVLTDAAGDAPFSVSLPAGTPPDAVITATATDPAGNTSEFSAALVPSAGPQSVSLSIVRAGATVVLSWPSAAAGYQLEAAPSLGPPISWQTVTTGISDDGTFKSFVVTNGQAPASQFFRLKQ